MIHLELMYMCGIRKGSSSFFSMSTPSTASWKDYSVLVEGSQHPYWKSSEHKRKGLFLHPPSCPIVLSLPLCLHYTLLMTVALKNCHTIFFKMAATLYVQPEYDSSSFSTSLSYTKICMRERTHTSRNPIFPVNDDSVPNNISAVFSFVFSWNPYKITSEL